MPLFSFSLDTFQITDTRSAHKDTDYVCFTVIVGGQTAQIQVKPMGDLNNGTFSVGMGFTGVSVQPGQTVVLNYLIINAGGPTAAKTIEGDLGTLGNRLATVPNLNLPPLTSCLQQVATTFADELSAMINPNSCDGLVAAEQNTFAYDDLVRDASPYPGFEKTTTHVGAAARSGCNARPSNYIVHWSVSLDQSVITPGVTQMTETEAVKKLATVGLIGQHFAGPGAWVIKQTPGPNTPAPSGSYVELTTMVQP